MTSAWFPLQPTDSSFSRITLDFGLRGANLHFLELVVPGIGGVSFVRQLTWALAGLALRDTLVESGQRIRATPLANAIEALACKADYLYSPDDVSDRVLGRRAFKRDGPDVFSFADLSDRTHYVQNTFRATAVRALRDRAGLGFASGQRFDGLELHPVGQSAVDALLDASRIGRTSLKNWLSEWLAGGQEEPPWRALREALSPDTPSRDERAIVRSRLLDVVGPDADKRRALATVLEQEDEFPGIDHVIRRLGKVGHGPLMRQLELARAFGALLDACIRTIEALTEILEKAGQLHLDAAAGSTAPQLASLRETASRYLAQEGKAPASSNADARRFARAASLEDALVLQDLIRREGRVVGLVDGVVHKGPLFRNLRRVDNTDDDEGLVPEEEGTAERTFRLARFHELLRDTRGRRS